MIERKRITNAKGITLIALVITIIVLLILAGVTISALTGDSGILKNAEKAKEKTNLTNAKEQVAIATQGALLKAKEQQTTITYENLNEELGNLTNKYTITPKEDAPVWTVTVGDYKTYITKDGHVEEPVTNPYDADEWTYAWTYNDTWSEMITAGNPAEGKIVAKFYATGNEITPPSFDGTSFSKGTEYHMVIEGKGDMGALGDEGDAWLTAVDLYPYVTEVAICDGITKIADNAFLCNISLNEVSISNSVTNIGNNAFLFCASLTNITIPNSVTDMGEGVFDGCAKLANIVISKSITSIESYTFSDCTSIVNIVIPEGVTSIGAYAFKRCASLKSIVIPNSVTSIEDNAFDGCASLNSIVIPNSVTSIGANVFMGCANLKSIVIPDKVASIEGNIFANCINLTSVTIPKSITSIKVQVFNNCQNLKSITYKGTKSEWNNIVKDTYKINGESIYWNTDSSVTTIICADGNITL